MFQEPLPVIIQLLSFNILIRAELETEKLLTTSPLTSEVIILVCKTRTCNH